jgi:hypothetical protein
MFPSIASALALVASFAAAQNSQFAGLYFIQDMGAPLVVERLDPVLFPGTVASHVHSIVGANTFGPTVSFDSLQAATCSTGNIKADKSVYWFPELYFHSPQNGSFIQVPERPEHKIYYFNRAGSNETIEEFPKDFRMVAGNPALRSMPSTPQGKTITEWFCHGPPDEVGTGFPSFTNCDYGFAGSIHFPHCWNGNAFDINNPYAHMSYPMGDHSDSGYCPQSHPHVMPHIFVEFWFDVRPFNGLYTQNDHPWVLAMGDPTGYGFHGDFINGWQPGVLLNAMNNCRIGESGAPLSDCFEVYTQQEINACKIAPVVNEVVTGWLDALPGCNPIQAGPADAVKPTCNGDQVTTGATSSSSPNPPPASSSVASSTGGSTSSSTSAANTNPTTSATTQTTTVTASTTASATPSPTVVNVTLPPNWSYAGCYTDNLNPRSLGTTGVLFAGIGAGAVTSTACVAYCAKNGFNIAGTEFGSQCFCDNALTNSQVAPASVCNMPCQGNSSEVCGGAGALSVFATTGTKLVVSKKVVKRIVQ